MPVPPLRPDTPNIFSRSTPAEDELAVDRAEFTAAIATLRNDIVAMARDRLGKTGAVKHIGGIGGVEMMFFKNGLDDALSDLTARVVRSLDSREEDLR